MSGDVCTMLQCLAKNCAHCHNPLPVPAWPTQKFCSEHCRKVDWAHNKAAA